MTGRAVLLAALLTACGPAWAGEITVGVAIPADGPKAPIGHVILEAARSEIARRAAADPGLGLKLVDVDDGCSAAGGTAAAERLVAERPALVIGHPCSNAAVAAAKVYAAAQVPLVAIGPRSSELTARPAGPQIFRIGGRDDREAADTVAVFAPILKETKVAVVHDRTAMARAVAEAVAAGLRRGGVPDVVIETIVAGERDYNPLVQRLKGLGVGAVYFAGFQAEAALIVDGARSAGMEARFIGSSALTGLKRPGLCVMAPRTLADTQVEAAVGRVLDLAVKAAKGGEPVAGALASEFDEEGDDAQPSFVPQPSPLQ